MNATDPHRPNEEAAVQEESAKLTSKALVRVLAWCLAIIIGGIGWLAVSFGPSLWHSLVGTPLVFLAAWLLRAARSNA